MICWREKNLSKKELLILTPNQGVLKNEEKPSHFGFINKILHNFQPIKFMIYFKLTILWKKKQKKQKTRDQLCLFLEGNCRKHVSREIDSDYCLHKPKGLCFVEVMLFGFDFTVSVLLKIHPCLLPSSWIIMTAAWISRFEANHFGECCKNDLIWPRL